MSMLVYIDEVYDISMTNYWGEGSKTLYDTLLDAFTDLGLANPFFLVTITTHPSIVRQGNSPM